MHIPRALVSRDSTGSSTGTPQNLSLILGVALSIVAVLLVVFLIVWRIIIVKRRQEAAFSSTTHSESLSRPPEKFTSNTLRGFKLPNKSEPMQHPRIDPYVLPQPPAPTFGVASASADSFGNTASSDYHYKTWRTVASSRSIDDPHMFADRTSQTSARMQAREGLNATGEMKDLISMLNSQPIESKAARNALSPTLAVKPMRPISVASTLVAPHTVTKDFGSMPHGLKRTHSVERTSDGYNSDATTTAQVPSVMRRPKFNPREGAPPIIPSIYFQPFELDNVPNNFLARSNSMDSRRTSTATAVAGPLRDRVLSQLGRSPSARQNYPPPTTRKRQNSEPPKIPALPRLSTITDGRVGTHTDAMMMPLTRSLAPRASVAPSVSEYPESRAGSIYVDPDMPLSHAPLSPTVVPSRNNSARSGWI